MFEGSDSMYSHHNQSRMMRKKTPDENISSQSVLTTVHQFVAEVNSMNQTIMMPSRLLDMELSDSNKPVPDILRAEKDPREVYNVLNDAKNDLLYGVATDEPEPEDEPIKARCRRDTCIDKWADISGRSSSNSRPNSSRSNNSNSPPTRRESSISMLSVASNYSDSSFDSDAAEESHEVSSDGTDSALGADETGATAQSTRLDAVSSVSDVKAQVRLHLLGLKSCLAQLVETTAFLTEAYREEISK